MENKIITQKEWFKKQPTDYLLSMRFQISCYYPQNENDEPDFDNDRGKMWIINKKWLYDELATRPHRIRAKDRRKN